MTIIAPDIGYFDLEFQRLHRVIGTLFLQGRGGITIVDPGPSTTLATLRQHLAGIGATMDDVTAVFLTHIHLDHAGATGVIVRENPRIKVHVHERGAPHMVDPAKLVASASRLYGEMMQALWGEILPVPADVVVPLFGGERLEAGGRTWDVAYTPGHASHHVSYFSADLGLALVGDTAGVQVVRGGFVLPPTPPPDIDPPLWRSSLSLIERWRPRSLFLTHFGVVDEPAAHVAELRDHLDLCERLAREAVARSTDPAVQEAWFTDQMRATIARGTSAADLEAYEVAGRIDLNWRGLERYLRKKGMKG